MNAIALAMKDLAKVEGTEPERSLATQLKQAGLPEPLPQFHFDPSRKWAFDFAWTFPNYDAGGFWKLAVEVEGGTWMTEHGGKSRHTTGQGFERDCEKYLRAAELGWQVVRVTPKQIDSGRALEVIRKILEGKR